MIQRKVAIPTATSRKNTTRRSPGSWVLKTSPVVLAVTAARVQRLLAVLLIRVHRGKTTGWVLSGRCQGSSVVRAGCSRTLHLELDASTLASRSQWPLPSAAKRGQGRQLVRPNSGFPLKPHKAVRGLVVSGHVTPSRASLGWQLQEQGRAGLPICSGNCSFSSFPQ